MSRLVLVLLLAGCGLTPAEQCRRTGSGGGHCSGCCSPASPGSTEYRCVTGVLDAECGLDGLECAACATGKTCQAESMTQGGQCK